MGVVFKIHNQNKTSPTFDKNKHLKKPHKKKHFQITKLK